MIGGVKPSRISWAIAGTLAMSPRVRMAMREIDTSRRRFSMIPASFPSPLWERACRGTTPPYELAETLMGMNGPDARLFSVQEGTINSALESGVEETYSTFTIGIKTIC